MNRRFLFAPLFVFLFAGCTSSDSPYVFIKNARYDPRELTVQVGTTVTWVNEDRTMHTVTSDEEQGPLDSGRIEGQGSWKFTFTDSGEFPYHCEPHSSRLENGTWVGQTGMVLVRP